MHTALDLVEAHRRWMGFNLLLALVPLVMGLVVFDPRRRRTAMWWTGVALFVVFLPNAPYVVSDLVHLPADAHAVQSTKVVLGGLLPLYGAFIVGGIEAYVVSLALVRHYLRAIGWGNRAIWFESAAHLASAAGVVLGRINRLNSWDPVIHPDKVASSLAALALKPILIVSVAAVIIAASRAVRMADELALRTGLRVAVRLAWVEEDPNLARYTTRRP